MDLGVVKKRIPLYPNPEEFKKDMDQIFHNCLLYNKVGSDAYGMGVDVQKSYIAAWDANYESLMAAFNTSLDSSEQEELLKEYQINRVMPELPQFEEPVRKTSSRKQHEAEKNQRSAASEKAASSVVEEKPVSKARGGGRKSSKGSKKEASSSQVEAKEEVAVPNTAKTATRAKASNKPVNRVAQHSASKSNSSTAAFDSGT
ncbi:hypothetical protein Pmar_PMAR018969 [Perkinsus marinus ATCC 50983]|uniref:Bromo domain-containing protein n=1 Tax=Perkinsus marinus (strain ATCC 50983 / TXsc) TaxID=423536 RepID=C5L5F5_PERM5|nr:hypothetical protein Pmar_PMAR018969 [Perkinsus marinus ATCC 50983]EER08038.1 hypothetical protein Pmar_PMAR018969 [Perkinsus marinus ATCC 50983]|eukprot:XP_002776222.1 hypothetical protein Pmar_PMAR018969 [Perkinsus marinus ATCC 50983]